MNVASRTRLDFARSLMSLVALATLSPACSSVDTGALALDAGPGGGGADGSVVRADGASGMCAARLVLCGAACIDPSADTANCGGCGRPCAAGATCVSGTCTCAAGTPGCGSAVGNPDRCGASAVSCAASEVCSGGTCTCRPGLTRVGDTCVDLSSDPANCGTPGTRCNSGVCSAGVCTTTCAAGTMRCDAACVDLQQSPLHCGECGRACARDQVCVRGGCRDYTSAGECTTCPCRTTCTGDTPTCCSYPGTSSPICISADSC